MSKRSDGKACDRSHDTPARRRGKCPRCGSRDPLLTAANTMHNTAFCQQCRWQGCQCETLGRYVPDVPNETGWILREVYGYKGHVDYVCIRDANDAGKSNMEWYHEDEPPSLDLILEIAAGKPIPSGRFRGRRYAEVHG